MALTRDERARDGHPRVSGRFLGLGCLLALLLPVIAYAQNGEPPQTEGLVVYGVGALNLLLTLMTGGRQIQNGGATSRMEADLKALDARLAETRERYVTSAAFSAALHELETRTQDRMERSLPTSDLERLDAQSREHEARLQTMHAAQVRQEVLLDGIGRRLDALEKNVDRMEKSVERVEQSMARALEQQAQILDFVRGNHHGR